jgi:hypothetical protein
LDATLDHDRKKWIPEFYPILTKFSNADFLMEARDRETIRNTETALIRCLGSRMQASGWRVWKSNGTGTARMAYTGFFAQFD